MAMPSAFVDCSTEAVCFGGIPRFAIKLSVQRGKSTGVAEVYCGTGSYISLIDYRVR